MTALREPSTTRLRGGVRRARIPLLLSLLLVLSAGPLAAQTEERAPITPEEAAEHEGTEQTVCGAVVEASYVAQMDGRPTFLNFGNPWPDQVMSVVIYMSAREEFPEPPETMFRDENVCVTGVVEITQQGTRIVVEDPEAITIQEEEEEDS